jgi:hypothetical protein
MSKFGISGIWKSPATTIPAVLVGIGGIATALGWCDAESWQKYSTGIGSALIMVIGLLYKGSADGGSPGVSS